MSKESKSATTDETKQAAAKTDKSSTGSFLGDLQASADAENAAGFRGTEVDPTPNFNYTVAGVTSDAPTPETHAGASADARAVTGIGLSGLEAAQLEKDFTAKARKEKK